MKSFISVIYFLLALHALAIGQNVAPAKVVITGARFSYPLVEYWITRYKAIRPETQIIIQHRTTTDPSGYDILVEGYEHDEAFRSTRDYLYIGQYTVLPFSNSRSALAVHSQSEWLTNDDLKQLYFHDPFAERKSPAPANTTIYTRLQKAAVPATFAAFYGYSQQDIKGKSIGGADEHLVKAVQKDSSGVSYASVNLLYDNSTRSLREQLSLIPFDLDGNKKITPEEERAFTSLSNLVDFLEKHGTRNVPSAHLHLSLPKVHDNTEAVRFLQWIAEHGQEDLHQFGFLLPEPALFEREKSKFATRAGLR